jgi:hypothetical protein
MQPQFFSVEALAETHRRELERMAKRAKPTTKPGLGLTNLEGRSLTVHSRPKMASALTLLLRYLHISNLGTTGEGH